MNILFLSQDYYPKLSGVPNVVKYLAEGLAANGHYVSVVTCSHGNKSKKEIFNGVHIYRHDIYQNILKRPAGRIREYVEFVCNFEAEVVIFECTQWITTDLILPHLHRIKGKKILHAHGFSGICTINNSKIIKKCDGFLHTIGHTYNWIRSWYYFKHWLPKYINDFDASMVLSGTDSAKNYLDFFLKEGNYVLENAADDMFFDNYRGKCSNLLKDIVDIKSSKYCFSCANYTVVKNQKEMLREFYKTSANDLALVCVGSTNNSYYQDCLRLCSELEQQYGHHEVHLLHHIDRKLIPLLESNASIYLVSSIWEEYSISIIEAMAQGVPFISTNVGNARILPGGITLDCIDDMHVAIDDLIKNGNLYTSLSEKGKQFAYSHCRQSVAVKTLENIINNTLK